MPGAPERSDSELVQELRSEIGEFVRGLLDGYRPVVHSHPKVFHDPLWGTQRFEAHEVGVIDSPILQRLRRVHQTSYSLLTYPSTGHSRFEHSLGAAAVAGRMAEAISARRPKHLDLDPQSGDLAHIRLAALLHDCGHGFASHASEDVYRWLPAILAAQRTPEFGGAKAGEILSSLIATSEPFRELLQTVAPQCRVDLAEVGRLVLGHTDDSSRHFIAQIVNGPFDADRVDYIVRDSHYSGVTAGIDVERLFHDLDLATVAAGRVSLVVHSTHAIEQLLFAKIHLFVRVYRHQKVLAADHLLGNLVREVRRSRQAFLGSTFERVSEFLRITDADLLAIKAEDAPQATRSVLRALQWRALPVRALTLNHSTIVDGDKPGTLYKVMALGERETGLEELRDDIIHRLPEGSVTPELVVVAIPNTPSLREASSTFVMVRGRDTPVPLAKLFRLDEWLSTFAEAHWGGYVFCPRGAEETVSRAAIEALGGRGIAVLPSAVPTPIAPPPAVVAAGQRPLRLAKGQAPELPITKKAVARLADKYGKPFEGLAAVVILHFLNDLPPLLQLMEELGLQPNRTFLVQKNYQYPGVDEIVAELRGRGYNIESASVAEDVSDAAARALGELDKRLGDGERFFVLEDGGYVTPLLHEPRFARLQKLCRGAVEQTEKGRRRIEVVSAKDGLEFPVETVARSVLKRNLEASEVGTALAYHLEQHFRSTLNQDLRVRVLVVGFGTVGKFLARALRSRGSYVVVYDASEDRLIEASISEAPPFEVLRALQDQDLTSFSLIVGTSGETSISGQILDHVRDRIVIASGSSEQVEISISDLRHRVKEPASDNIKWVSDSTEYTLKNGVRVQLLADGFPINFVLGRGISKPVIDPILAELVIASVSVCRERNDRDLKDIDRSVDSALWEDWRKLYSGVRS